MKPQHGPAGDKWGLRKAPDPHGAAREPLGERGQDYTGGLVALGQGAKQSLENREIIRAGVVPQDVGVQVHTVNVLLEGSGSVKPTTGLAQCGGNTRMARR